MQTLGLGFTWEQLAPGLKTIEDATEIRRRVLLTFELAERQMVETAFRCCSANRFF